MNGEPARYTMVHEAIDWNVCAEITRAHGRTFAFASELLPRERKRAIHAVYAYCRYADDIIDRREIDGLDTAMRALQDWRDELDRPRHPVAVAFAAARSRFGIERRPAEDLFEGLATDVDFVRYRTWDDLDRYCYQVAGTVGLMTAPILGCRRASALPQAVALGKAMQLTNILRDVAEDAARGRIYVPLEDLERFGVSEDSLLNRAPDGDYRGLVAFQIARARSLYAEGLAGANALLPSGRLAAIAGARLYGKILDRIEHDEFDGFCERASISTAAKIRELPTVAAMMVRMSIPRGGIS